MDIEEYYSKIPDFRYQRLKEIHELIVTEYPDVVVSMRYKMPTFERGENGISIANQKNYISVYTCCYDHIASFREKHPKIKGGKGCLNFKDSDDLPLDDLLPVITSALTMKK